MLFVKLLAFVALVAASGAAAYSYDRGLYARDAAAYGYDDVEDFGLYARDADPYDDDDFEYSLYARDVADAVHEVLARRGLVARGPLDKIKDIKKKVDRKDALKKLEGKPESKKATDEKAFEKFAAGPAGQFAGNLGGNRRNSGGGGGQQHSLQTHGQT